MKHFYKNLRAQELHVLLMLCLILFTQCTSNRLSMREGQQIEELGVCLTFAPNVPAEFQEQFEESLDQYIVKYNSEAHAFKLTECQDNSSLQLRIEDVKYTTSTDRATGIVVSALGLVALPAVLVSSGAQFIAAFYYFPNNFTLATTAFSNDIAHPSLGVMQKVYKTGGMFGNDEKQRIRHAKKFELHLNTLFTEIESTYRKTSGRRAKGMANSGPVELDNSASN